jgi:predicted nuclease of predicted toxin-antitoxin system
MRVLIDENLPATLATALPIECVHATDFGRNPTDHELWIIARDQNFVVLTRDTDFFDRLMLEGPPPKVIWIRLGNLRRRDLEKKIGDLWPILAGLLDRADLIEIYPHAVETFQHSSA